MIMKKLLEKSKELYDSYGSIYSTALKENIDFNRYGWKHLRFDGHGHKRSPRDIIYRLKLLKFVPDIIKNCKTSTAEEKRFIYFNGILRTATFTELIHKCIAPNGKSKLITVVIRKFEIGRPHFYSIRNKR